LPVVSLSSDVLFVDSRISARLPTGRCPVGISEHALRRFSMVHLPNED
jgi:hypothetical protein